MSLFLFAKLILPYLSLVNLVKDYSLLNHEETAYARNPLTHVDFFLFRKMDKSPLLAI